MDNLLDSKQLERKILGKMFLSKDVASSVILALKADDFFDKGNRKIFEVIRYLLKTNQDIDTSTVIHFLASQELSGEVLELSMTERTPYGSEALTSLLKDISNRRRTVSALKDTIDTLMDREKTFIECISMLNSCINTAYKNNSIGDNSKHISEIVKNALAEINIAKNSKGEVGLGLTSGIGDLDNAIDGFSRGEVIVCGARPSMGKTTLVVNILKGLSMNNNCLFFSMEQKENQVIGKMLAQNTSLDSRKLAKGQVDDIEIGLLGFAGEDLSKLNLWVDERCNLSIDEIESAIAMKKELNGLDVVCIDYLQYLDYDNSKENAMITTIMKRLKNIAKKYNINILLLSQLSREVEKRVDKRPLMSDLRASGAIEQEADKVLLLYRDEYYNKESEDKGLLEVIIAKFRNGETGTIKLNFDLSKQEISSIFSNDMMMKKYLK